jgi:hypothetical protein
MNTTTAPAMKAALFALFKAGVDDSTEVWWPRPNEEHQREENVYIARVQSAQSFAQIGNPSNPARHEEFTVTVEVEVFRSGTDAQGTEERLWAIVTKLEEAIDGGETTLRSIQGVQSVIAARTLQETEARNDGLLSTASIGVAVTARI